MNPYFLPNLNSFNFSNPPVNVLLNTYPLHTNNVPLNTATLGVPIQIPVFVTPYEMQNAAMQPYLHNQFMTQQLVNQIQRQALKTSQGSMFMEAHRLSQMPTLNSELPVELPVRHNIDNKVKHQILVCDPNKSTKAHIKDIVYFLLDNVGALSPQKLEEEKEKYKIRKDLWLLFDALLSKYTTEVRTKQETINNLFKKALKYMKQKISKEFDHGMMELERKNFQAFLSGLTSKLKEFSLKQKKINKSIDSFKKNLNNFESANFEFLEEAFSSQEFLCEFQRYTAVLEHLFELENNKKIEKFVQFIESSMKRSLIKDIKKFKRAPWPKTWIQTMKEVAMGLIAKYGTAQKGSDRKLMKYEEDVSIMKEEDSLETLSQSAKVEETSA